MNKTAHVWVNVYETCDACNYCTHRCYFCGTDLDHEGFEVSGVEHTVEYCRPDLVAHEPGELCTWPVLPGMGEDWNREHGRPGCYWDHEKNQLGRETSRPANYQPSPDSEPFGYANAPR